MPGPITNAPLPPARWPGVCVIIAGLVSAAAGCSIIIAWYAHWTGFLQIFPDAAPMQYNTAVCFILCGAGLILLNTRFAGLARLPAAIAALLTSLTLLEYLAGGNFGIDLLFFRPYFEVATAFPGRMAPLTAICFVLFSVALLLCAATALRVSRLAFSGLLATVIGMVGIIALIGYVTGMRSAYGWGAYSLMAFNTAALFLVLGAGLLLWCRRAAERENYKFLQWVPVAASVTLIVMVGMISASTVGSLRSALEWRKHTYEVLIAGQSLLTDFEDIQRGMSGYVLSGRQDLRAPFDLGALRAPRELATLIRLTSDNPLQQQRLKMLDASLSDVLSQAGSLISARDREGLPAVAGAISAGDGKPAFDRATALIAAFLREEQRLLAVRGAIADTDFHSTVHLLFLGTLMASIFLVAGGLLVRREIKRRQRIELELRDATEKVQTLSGLLPICANCKSIRDDKGYWSRIEVYIQERSDAKFSHGLCENCVRELYPSIADQILNKMAGDPLKTV